MDWLNIHRSTLSSEEFLGCEPVQRATWLCLLAYCADQENGGRIADSASWGDRKWQQVVGVTREEVMDECSLWSWDGVDVTVWAYPVDKEEEVRRNRVNGGKGGRPPKPINNQVVSSGLTQTGTQTEPTAPISAETERKGIGKEEERKRKGNRKDFVPPTLDETIAHCKEHFSDWHHSSVRELFRHYVSTDWTDRDGKKIVNWKNKFSNIYKIKSSEGRTGPTAQFLREKQLSDDQSMFLNFNRDMQEGIRRESERV